MKTLQLILASVVLLFAVVSTNAQTLIPELKSFEKIVDKKWIGRFDDPNETSENYLTIETILDGAAILETHTIPTAGNYSAVTLYYWNPEKKTVAATRITYNGWLFRFTVTPQDSIIHYEGTRYSPEGNVSKVSSERIIHTDGSIEDNKGNRDSRTYRRR